MPAGAENCPANTYRMLTPTGVICVPYAQGAPRTPGPGPNHSTISPPSGPGGDGHRGAPAASAK